MARIFRPLAYLKPNQVKFPNTMIAVWGVRYDFERDLLAVIADLGASYPADASHYLDVPKIEFNPTINRTFYHHEPLQVRCVFPAFRDAST